MSHNTHSTVGQIAGRAGLRIADCELRIDRSPIRNPKSEIRNFTERRGISLTEVLIAMGILTVGLLGVAAIFPVAGFYMQKGEVADRGSAIAQAAYNELITRGMLNPESWRVMVPIVTTSPFTLFKVDNKGAAPSPASGTFTRPFAGALREAQSRGMSPLDIARNFGGGFVIDPLGVNAFAAADSRFGSPARNLIGTAFPASNFVWFTAVVNSQYPWSPWSGAFNSAMRRVTFSDGANGLQMGQATADRLFRSPDDLSLDFPSGQDKPSLQPIDLGDLNNDGRASEPLARRFRGDYSWLATVVPSTPQGLLALANGTAGHTYEVSVVVFHKRAFPGALPVTTDDMYTVAAEERMVKGRIVSTGLSGGEIRLERHPNDDPSKVRESPFERLRKGQWILLCGPHPASTAARPSFVARWYRVLSIEKEVNGIVTNSTNQRLVTLRGPQWPWQPADNINDDNHTSNSLCVGIIPGAVAVHAKTVQIEGDSVWNGGVQGMTPSPTQPQWTLR